MAFSRSVPFLVVLVVLVAVGLAACHAERPPSHPVGPSAGVAPLAPTAVAPEHVPAPVAARPTAPPAVQAQMDRGRMLFARNCTACHGAGGEGSPRAPGVIGAGTLPQTPPRGRRVRTGQFRTAMDLGLFIKNEMPYGGTHLPMADVACVLAWLLQQHGITPQQTISPATAGAIRLR